MLVIPKWGMPSGTLTVKAYCHQWMKNVEDWGVLKNVGVYVEYWGVPKNGVGYVEYWGVPNKVGGYVEYGGVPKNISIC